MTQPRQTPVEPEGNLPMPPRQFRWYVTFWHIVYLGLLSFIAATTVWNGRAALGWREAALLTLIAGQVALYLWNFVFPDCWPLPAWRWAAYFGGSIVLWLIEWQFDENLGWLGMAYFGQMLGMLPPLITVPGTFVLFTLIIGLGRNLNFSVITSGDMFGPWAGWGATIAFYLFMTYVMNTSARRGALVQELRTAQAELEAARAHDAELAALRERERLARDLHDSLGHALVSISVQLEAIQRLYRVDANRANEQVEALKSVTRATMDELRRSLAGLRAPGLGDRPLAEALHTLAVDTGQRTGLNLTCHIAEGTERLTPAVAEMFWRVAQESLTNVERHAGARSVELRLEIAPAMAALRVRDDGRGLPSDTRVELPGHYGLRGLRERVEGVGGELTLVNGNGLTVEAKVPLL